MTDNNISGTETLEQLQQQKKELEKKIKRQIGIERNRTIATIIASMNEFNITIGDIEAAITAKTNKTDKEVVVRYINPETGATWTGKGKRPKWVLQALEQGRDLEDFAIK